MNAVQLSRHARSWYGLPVEIVIEGDYWHWVKAGPVPLPHPPVVNLIVRHGLPREARLKLSYIHEMGHIQTLPLALVHMAWVWKHRSKRVRGPLWYRFAWWALFLPVHQAVWELAAEGYVFAQNPREYVRRYKDTGSARARVFWVLMMLFASIGTWFLVRNEQT